MVYSVPDIDNNFSVLADPPPDRNVRIRYNDQYIHQITEGNVPLISIKEASNTNDNGELYSSTVNLTLNGKILPKTIGGTSGILSRYVDLTNLFYGTGTVGNSGYNGILEVRCGSTDPGTTVFAATGVRIKSINLDSSQDNWVLGADYSVELEYYMPRALWTGYYVKNTVDSWTIEPLEDYVYASSSGIKFRGAQQEFHNPKMKPTAPTSAAGQPSTLPAVTTLYTIPQYKISRKISAVGLPSLTGLSGTFTAYQEAQKWVKDRIGLTYLGTGTGDPHISLLDSTPYLYNHLRTINFSIHAGSYEVNETWLAMPVKIGYTEDYTVETSSDEAFNKTVKINGTIKGLARANSGVMSGVSGLNPYQSVIDLSGAMAAKTETEGVGYSLRDADPSTTVSNITTISSLKYQNAYNAWIEDIKPYIYRRASMVINSFDRNQSPLSYITTPPSPPNDPTLTIEKPLNPNPVSLSETHDPRKGTINYSCEFTNKFKYFDETVAESITISDDNPIDVVNEAFVLGRRLGPVLQGLGTITSAKKTIDLEVMVVPPTSLAGFFMSSYLCPLYINGELYTKIDTLINQLKPFGDRANTIFGSYGTRIPTTQDQGNLYIAQDSHSWDPTEGVYRRSVQWVYQHCSTTTKQMDY
jgi:hypothetical protein